MSSSVAGNSLLGKIDDFRIYTRNLSIDEIKYLYNIYLLNYGTSSTFSYTTTTNLVCWYQFNNSALLTDSSGNSRTLTNNNTVTLDTSDYRRGNASASFSGANYLSIANTGAFSPASFTVCFWCKLVYSYTGNYDSDVQTIASCGSELLGWKLQITDKGSGVFSVNMGLGYNNTTWYVAEIYQLARNDFGQWLHIAFTWDATTETAISYVNGIYHKTVTGQKYSALTNNAFIIGSYNRNSILLATNKDATLPSEDWSTFSDLTISGWFKTSALADGEKLLEFATPIPTHPFTVSGITPVSDGTVGDYYVTFTSGSYNVTFTRDTKCDILLVGGGGGGGLSIGAGGGAGGLVYVTNHTLVAGTYTITVGAGAPGQSAAGTYPTVDGGNSTINLGATNIITALGGATGQGQTTAYAGNNNRNGGSGAGGTRWKATGGSATQKTNTSGISSTYGYGNAGGNANGTDVYPYSAGGGGGAGGVGGNGTSSSGGNGGVGLQVNITGINTYYAGGGAGFSDSASAGTGGSGGGGNAGVSGTNGLGGGGGGSGSGTAGNGGSGVVIIRYNIGNNNIVIKKVSTNLSFQIDNTSVYTTAAFPNNTWAHILWNIINNSANGFVRLTVTSGSTTENTYTKVIPKSGTYINKLSNTANTSSINISTFRILTIPVTTQIKADVLLPTASISSWVYYQFASGALTTDSSGNNRTLTNNGGVSSIDYGVNLLKNGSKVDDFRLYNVVLSADTIKQIVGSSSYPLTKITGSTANSYLYTNSYSWNGNSASTLDNVFLTYENTSNIVSLVNKIHDTRAFSFHFLFKTANITKTRSELLYIGDNTSNINNELIRINIVNNSLYFKIGRSSIPTPAFWVDMMDSSTVVTSSTNTIEFIY
ncbi:glycine-rich domain-containing protein, partial [Flavobacterium sp.]|uniref:glycine-rich domain-containing protein n=1 Tax=Flavobacterium sp. TaxID=239 RepID=UPI0037BF051A